jgi:hypothetical protein
MKRLSEETELRRKELEDQRLFHTVERAVELQTQQDILTATIRSVQSGRDEKRLSTDVETRREVLAFGRLERVATNEIDLKHQQLHLKKLISNVQTGRNAKTLSDEIESRRQQLADERRQRAEQRSQQLRAENKQLRQRLTQVHGKDRKALNPLVEAERHRLSIERLQRRQEQKEILRAENQVHKAMLEATQTSEYYSSISRRDGALDGDNDCGCTFVPSFEGAARDHVQDMKRSEFIERRELARQRAANEMVRHKAEHRRILTETCKGRDTKALDDDIEEHRRLLAEKRQHEQQLHKIRLLQNEIELRTLKTEAKGKDVKSLDDKIESHRAKLKMKRLKAKEDYRCHLTQHKAHLRSIKHRARSGRRRSNMTNSSATTGGGKSTPEQTRECVETALRSSLMTHGILVTKNTGSRNNSFVKDTPASPSKNIVSSSAGSPTSVMGLFPSYDVSYEEVCVGHEEVGVDIHSSSLWVSMKRLKVAERTHQELQKHKATLMERLARAETNQNSGGNYHLG